MIDIENEHLLTFRQAADYLPRRRRGEKTCKTSLSTIWRWVEIGIKGVKLEVACIGGTRYTSKEGIQRFSERVTTVRNGGSTPTGPTAGRTEAQRRKDSARAGKTLGDMIANPPKRTARSRKATAAK